MNFDHLIKSFFKNFKKSEKNIENTLKSKLDKQFIHFTGMCRTSFILILDFLIKKYPKKKELIICSYNLKEMIDIARLKNFKIKLLDIDINTGVMNRDLIQKTCNSNTAAILFTNMFNSNNSLIELKKFCKENEILLIEDNAIYYGNYYLDNEKKKYSGSFGDVSLLSFGIMKNISAIYGGALLTSNREISEFVNENLKRYKSFSKFLYLKNIILFGIMKILLSKICYNLFFFYLIKFSTSKNINFLLNSIYPSLKFKKKKSIPPEYFYKISPTSIKIIDQIIHDPEFEKYETIRRNNNQLYYNNLKGNNNIGLINFENIYFQNFLDFPIIVKNKKNLVNYLLKKGLETRAYFYTNCEDIIDENFNNNSNYFEKNLICLPSHHDINENKVKEYCSAIEKFYNT